MTQRLTDALLDRGLYTRVAIDCICLAPPLVIEEDELDRIVDIIGERFGADDIEGSVPGAWVRGCWVRGTILALAIFP